MNISLGLSSFAELLNISDLQNWPFWVWIALLVVYGIVDTVAFVHRLASHKRKKKEDETALLRAQQKKNDSPKVQNVAYYLTSACDCGCLRACIDCTCRLSECLCLYLLAALQAAWASEFQLQFQLYIFWTVCSAQSYTYVRTYYILYSHNNVLLLLMQCVHIVVTLSAPSKGLLCPVDALHCCGSHTVCVWGFCHHTACHFLQSAGVVYQPAGNSHVHTV